MHKFPNHAILRLCTYCKLPDGGAGGMLGMQVSHGSQRHAERQGWKVITRVT